MLTINRKRRRDWCDSCDAYTNHGFGVGCLVCTGVEPPPPAAPVHVTVLGMRYGGNVALRAVHSVDSGPARIDHFLVPRGQILHTIHSFRPCTVYVRGRAYQLRAGGQFRQSRNC